MIGDLSATDLQYSYGRRTDLVLDRLSISARAGEMVGVTGPSGCGKSTALFLMALLLSPDSGSVSFDGDILSSASELRRARFRATSIGFVFQDASLDRSRTVLSNICEPAVLARRDRKSAARRAAELVDELGVDVPLSRKCHGLSGGQAQRVALCRALVCDPQYILADEPTGNLDSGNEATVLDRLQTEAGAGRTILVVTHSREVLNRCSRVVELDDG